MIEPRKVPAQATHPSYELHSLGWKAFQQLCIAIAGEVWGQTVQGFFDSDDGGRDGAFHGTWTTIKSEVFEGSFTVQCKFTAQPQKVLRLSDLDDELSKAARLAERGLADNYFLFTNARLKGSTDEKLKAAFEAIPSIKKFTAFGPERISQFIQESSRLRMLVPRVYGLGDLSQILDVRAYEQSHEILSSLGDDFAKFVITNAYRNSAKALVEHGFVLLLGEPACGKSAIAAALALGALDEWGCFTLKIRDASDFVARSNPNEPKQFFWVDDAFGTTQLDWQAAVNWNRAFPHVRAAIRRGARVVFTSRDYIYRNARSFLKDSALPIINESQVVIRVDELTESEREQILYNHIRLGTQPPEYRKELIPLLKGVAAHKRFSPEIARRLGNPAFTKELYVSRGGLDDFVEHPVELLREIIRTLDAGSRAAIALVFMRGGMLASPITLSLEEERAADLLGASAADIRKSITAHAGSLLILVRQQGRHWWRFKHPTIIDAFAAEVAEDRELMDIYLIGTPVDRLLTEISCGDIAIAEVKVNVTSERYAPLMPRITEYSAKNWQSKNDVNRFLAFRCGSDFLEQYIEQNPDFIASLQMMSYFYAVAAVDLVTRLKELDLLPESERLRHVAAVRDLAVSTPDSGFLDSNTVGFLTTEERAEILEHVRSDFLTDLDQHIDHWRDNFSTGEDADEYFSTLKSALREYNSALVADPIAPELIAGGMAKIDEVIGKLQADTPPSPDRSDSFFDSHPNADGPKGSRSIFDDVDQ